MTDSPEVATAKRLLDVAKNGGFLFEQIAPGTDGPLRGVRETTRWSDEIYLAGFSDSCTATRRRRSSLVVPGGLPVLRDWTETPDPGRSRLQHPRAPGGRPGPFAHRPHSGGSRVNQWYLRSYQDGDAHYSKATDKDGVVTARCGLTFRPLGW